MILNILGFFILFLGVGLLFPEWIKKAKEELRKTPDTILLKPKKRVRIGKEILKRKKIREKKGFFRMISDAKQLLILSNRKTFLSWITILSFCFMMIGALFGIQTKNYFLVPVTTVAFGILPYLFVIFRSITWQKSLTEELETVLSIITTSYYRKEDIVKAIEESIPYINPPIRSVFEEFLMKANFINSNIKSSLRELQVKVHNDIWKEWIEMVIACQDNKEKKMVLTPIVQKLSDNRILTEELAGMLYAPVKEYIVMVILFFVNFPALSVLMPEWYRPLVNSQIGKFVIALCSALILFSVPRVMSLAKPISAEAMTE